MKKRNLKKLTIKKQLVSNLKTTTIVGGGRTNGKNCQPTLPPETEFCVTVLTCFCTVDAGCLLTFEVDIDGNPVC